MLQVYATADSLACRGVLCHVCTSLLQHQTAVSLHFLKGQLKALVAEAAIVSAAVKISLRVAGQMLMTVH